MFKNRNILEFYSGRKHKYTNSNDQPNHNDLIPEVENFIQRDEIFIKADDILAKYNIAIFSGLPGVGKSSFVSEYVRQYQKTGLIVKFFSANSNEDVYRGYLQLAEDMGRNDSGLIKKEIIDRIYASLTSQKEVFFVFEDVNNYKDIKEYLTTKPANIKILITSRKTTDFPQENVIQLEPFNLHKSINYLKKALNDIIDAQSIPDSKLEELVKKIGNEEGYCLPFHLHNVIKWFRLQNNSLSSIDDYLKVYGEGKDDDKTTELLLGTLNQSEILGKILQCASYLNSDFISINIISKIFNIDSENLKTHLTPLSDLGLITPIRGVLSSGIKIHQLTQTIVKKYIARHSDKEEFPFFKREELLSSLIQSLEEFMPELDTSIRPSDDEWKIANSAYPHVIKIAEIIKENEVLLFNDCNSKRFKQLASLYSKLGRYSVCITNQRKDKTKDNESKDKESIEYYNKEASKSKELIYAIEYYKKALELKKLIYTVDNSSKEIKLSIIKTLTDIGKVYNILGKDSDSLEYYNQAKEYINTNYEINSETAILYVSMAISYENLFNSSDSLDDNLLQLSIYYAKKSLDINRKLNNNKELSESFNILAGIYSTCCDPINALKYYNKALEIRKNLYKDEDHPDIANILNNIGLLYHTQVLKLRYIEDQKGIYGYRTMNDIYKYLQYIQDKEITDIYAFCQQQELTDVVQIENKALDYLNKSLLMFKNIYGESSIKIGEISYNLGLCHRYLSNVEYNLKHTAQSKKHEEKAIDCFKQASTTYKELYPEGHVQTIKSLNSLGLIYTNLGFQNKEIKYYEISSKYYNEASIIAQKLDPKDFEAVIKILGDNITGLKKYFNYDKYVKDIKIVKSGYKKATDLLNNQESLILSETSKSKLKPIFRNSIKPLEEALKLFKQHSKLADGYGEKIQENILKTLNLLIKAHDFLNQPKKSAPYKKEHDALKKTIQDKQLKLQEIEEYLLAQKQARKEQDVKNKISNITQEDNLSNSIVENSKKEQSEDKIIPQVELQLRNRGNYSLNTDNQNSNEITSSENYSVDTKRFNITISEKQMIEFKNAIDKGTEEEFMNQFIGANNISTKSDVYSLMLNCASIFEDEELVKYILENVNEKDNILTSIDNRGNSPISNLLHSNNEELLLLVNDYICKVHGKIEKTNLINEDTANITFVVKHPPSLGEMTPIDCFYDFILPLYSEQSLQNLIQDIGLMGKTDVS